MYYLFGLILVVYKYNMVKTKKWSRNGSLTKWALTHSCHDQLCKCNCQSDSVWASAEGEDSESLTLTESAADCRVVTGQQWAVWVWLCDCVRRGSWEAEAALPEDWCSGACLCQTASASAASAYWYSTVVPGTAAVLLPSAAAAVSAVWRHWRGAFLWLYRVHTSHYMVFEAVNNLNFNCTYVDTTSKIRDTRHESHDGITCQSFSRKVKFRS